MEELEVKMQKQQQETHLNSWGRGVLGPNGSLSLEARGTYTSGGRLTHG